MCINAMVTLFIGLSSPASLSFWVNYFSFFGHDGCSSSMTKSCSWVDSLFVSDRYGCESERKLHAQDAR
jgi:hypothetical protein